MGADVSNASDRLQSLLSRSIADHPEGRCRYRGALLALRRIDPCVQWMKTYPHGCRWSAADVD